MLFVVFSGIKNCGLKANSDMELFDEKVDYYKILGVDRKASELEIRNAFKKKSKIYHPDRNRDKTARERLDLQEEFNLISKAFAVLSDAAVKRQYDNSQAATFYDMRSRFQEAKETIDVRVPTELEGLDGRDPAFSEKFNALFEQQRAPDPNDVGAGEYGTDLAPRRRLEDGLTYNASDVPAPDKLFQDEKQFDPEKFHKLFEHLHARKAWGNTSVVHVESDEPEPLNGDLVEGTDIGTAVASFGGLMIVGKDRQSYDSVSSSDYRGAFGMSNPTLDHIQDIDLDAIERKRDKKLSEKDSARLMAERMAERNRMLLPTRETEKEDIATYIKRKEQQIVKEQDNNREFVKKYAIGQFGGLLADQAFEGDGVQDQFNR